MRLGDRKRIWIKNNRMSSKKVSGCLLILLILMLAVMLFTYFFKQVRPLVLEMARNQTHNLAEQAVHKAINKIFRGVGYGDLIRISRLEDGTVSALESDMTNVNRLKAEASMAICEEIGKIKETAIHIPLGSLTGSTFFAGVGPDIPVKLIPYGKSTVNFKSEFTTTGINQTRLEISLVAEGWVGIVMPAGRTVSQVKTELPIVQTVIVGKIPDNYVNIDRMGEGYEDDVMDLIN